MKKTVVDIPVPVDITSKLKLIRFIELSVEENINVFLADLFVEENFIQEVFNKTFNSYDWENLYFAIQELLKEETAYNNGIFMEHISSYLLSATMNLRTLMSFDALEFQDPDKGIDLMFLNEENNLDFYEVKSSIENDGKTYSTNEFIITKTKEAITSLFCSKLKTVSKLVGIREKSQSTGLEKIYVLAREMLVAGSKSMIDFASRKEVNFNICLIGKKIELNNERFARDIVDIFNTTVKCKENCSFIDEHKCNNNILDRVRIVNLISFQLLGELDLKEILANIKLNITIDQGISYE